MPRNVFRGKTLEGEVVTFARRRKVSAFKHEKECSSISGFPLVFGERASKSDNVWALSLHPIFTGPRLITIQPSICSCAALSVCVATACRMSYAGAVVFAAKNGALARSSWTPAERDSQPNRPPKYWTPYLSAQGCWCRSPCLLDNMAPKLCRGGIYINNCPPT